MSFDIRDEQLNYFNEGPLAIRLYTARHYKPHKHSDALEIVYCLKGTVNLVAGFQQILLNKGDFFSIDCEDIHCLYSNTDNIIMSIYIDLTKISGDMKDLKYVFFAFESMNIQETQKVAADEIDDILLALGLLTVNNKSLSIERLYKIANRMIELLIERFNWFIIDDSSKTEKMSKQTRDRFQRLSIYCQKNYSKKITLSILAKEECINENYISQYMKGTNFKSFMSMLNNIRCFYAENMLLTTDLPITEISILCGFSDTKYFYNSFKKWWGRTPKEHREWYRNYFEKDCEYSDYEGCNLKVFMQEFVGEKHFKRFLQNY